MLYLATLSGEKFSLNDSSKMVPWLLRWCRSYVLYLKVKVQKLTDCKSVNSFYRIFLLF